MTIAFQKFDQFVEDAWKGVHNLSTGALKLALCAAANAPVAGNSQLGDLTQINYANLSTRAITTVSCEQLSGTVRLLLTDHVLTASGTVAAFRYIVLYNDTPSGDPLLGFWDYGGSLTLLNGETLSLDFDGSAGAMYCS